MVPELVLEDTDHLILWNEDFRLQVLVIQNWLLLNDTYLR